jgi:diguanylate cyclase (GGDEF)-like protein/PAS domain S-box-containing protein
MSHQRKKMTPVWRGQEFAFAFIPIALLLGIVVFAYFYLDYTSELGVINTLEKSHAKLGKRSIERRIRELSKDVRVISESQSLKNFINNPSEKYLFSLSQEFQSICKHRDVFDQVRYLNAEGMEVLRVNYDNGDCHPVPDEQLQNKQGRYYFKDTIQLGKQEVFYSPLDLNVEQGVIEHPLKPMIRIGMPVYDQQDKTVGIILVNYLAAELLHELKGVMASEYSHPMLLNRDGYWLVAGRQSFEWGFMFDGGPNFGDEFPQIWDKMQITDMGQYEDASGIFTWSSVYPVEEGSISSTGSALPFSASERRIAAHEYVWRVGTHIMTDSLEQLSSGRIKKALFLYLVLLLIALVGSLFLAYERRRAITYLNDLKDNARRMRAITAELGEGLVVLDTDGKVTMMNPQAERLLGWAEATLIDKDFHELIHTDPRASDKNSPIQKVNTTQRLVHIEDDKFFTKSGGHIPVAYTASPFIIDGDNYGTIISFEDITERKAAKAQLAHLASHDSLTGLYNRREIEECLQRVYHQMVRYMRSMSICLIDIDHFKQVNDTNGHQIGDRVLSKLGKILRQMTRGADCCGRYGGEEFMLVLPETDLQGAKRLGELLRSRIEKTLIKIEGQEHPLSITVSVGIAELTPDISDPDQLVSIADKALYIAKDNGRNQVYAQTAQAG